LHLLALLLDSTARVSPVDLVLPFRVPYGTLAVGLGTIGLELFAIVAVSGWLRRRLDPSLWQWLHRLSYLAFGLLFLHALLGGTDFSDPLISALTWSVALALGLLSLARALFGKLPA